MTGFLANLFFDFLASLDCELWPLLSAELPPLFASLSAVSEEVWMLEE
jgi:hypothetical protein